MTTTKASVTTGEGRAVTQRNRTQRLSQDFGIELVAPLGSDEVVEVKLHKPAAKPHKPTSSGLLGNGWFITFQAVLAFIITMFGLLVGSPFVVAFGIGGALAIALHAPFRRR
jgi:hypothetical protein